MNQSKAKWNRNTHFYALKAFKSLRSGNNFFWCAHRMNSLARHNSKQKRRRRRRKRKMKSNSCWKITKAYNTDWRTPVTIHIKIFAMLLFLSLGFSVSSVLADFFFFFFALKWLFNQFLTRHFRLFISFDIVGAWSLTPCECMFVCSSVRAFARFWVPVARTHLENTHVYSTTSVHMLRLVFFFSS